MLRVKQGETSAFEEIVQRHKGRVYGLCLSLLHSREDAEEAAQDSFLKLFRGRQLFDEQRAVEPWLLRIAGNTCRDFLRRRRPAVPVTTQEPEGGSFMSLVPDPRGDAHSKEATNQAVRHAIEQMSDRHREPLVLRYLNGFTNAEIANALGISLSNVKLRLARAKDVLAGRLAEVREP